MSVSPRVFNAFLFGNISTQTIRPFQDDPEVGRWRLRQGVPDQAPRDQVSLRLQAPEVGHAGHTEEREERGGHTQEVKHTTRFDAK